MRDTIYREDAIRAFNKATKGIFSDKHLGETIVGQIPSADRPSAMEIESAYHEGVRKGIAEAYGAGRPQGKWIEIHDASRLCSILRMQCSVCGDEWLPEFARRYIYCPNCGARMRPKLQGKHFDSIIIDEDAMKGSDDE